MGEMKHYYYAIVLVCVCWAAVEIFTHDPKPPENCTYIKSEGIITPDLIITVGLKGMENDTDYVYRLQ